MADAPKSLGGHLFENMQRARKELRHRAHVYAHTKDRAKRDAAGEALEQAGIALGLACALQGLYSDCARPAGPAGNEWYRKLDPETALELDKAAAKMKKAHR